MDPSGTIVGLVCVPTLCGSCTIMKSHAKAFVEHDPILQQIYTGVCLVEARGRKQKSKVSVCVGSEG